MYPSLALLLFFFFNDTATTEIYTLSLHDALPISFLPVVVPLILAANSAGYSIYTFPEPRGANSTSRARSEEHTSELQSLTNLVCRLLLEKKKRNPTRALTSLSPDLRHDC